MAFRSHRQPLCRACGGKIPKVSETIWVYEKEPSFKSDHSRQIVAVLHTKEEAQKLVNDKIISINRSNDGSTIHRLGVWDGESYIDQFFCKGACAQRYAYMAVASPSNRCVSQKYADARDKQYRKEKGEE